MDWQVAAVFFFSVCLMLVPIIWDVVATRNSEAVWTAVVAISTCFLVAATIYNAVILAKTDDTLRDTLEEANRAWLTPTRYQVRQQPEGPLVTVFYQNVGRDPALGVRVSLLVVEEHLKKPISSVLEFPEMDWQAAKNVFEKCKSNPAQEGDGSIAFPSTIVEQNASSLPRLMVDGQLKTTVDSAKLSTGADILVAFTCLSYRSMNRTRHTGFCQYLAPQKDTPMESWQFKWCPVANFAE
nr:hypothetical protein [uncultured Bradyrhizobium sp.]